MLSGDSPRRIRRKIRGEEVSDQTEEGLSMCGLKAGLHSQSSWIRTHMLKNLPGMREGWRGPRGSHQLPSVSGIQLSKLSKNTKSPEHAQAGKGQSEQPELCEPLGNTQEVYFKGDQLQPAGLVLWKWVLCHGQ